MLVRCAIILGCFTAVSMIIGMLMPERLREPSYNLTNAVQRSSDYEDLKLGDLEFVTDMPGLFEVTGVELEGGKVFLTMEPTGNGSGYVYMEIVHRATGEVLESTIIKVAKNGNLLDMNSGNFSHYRESQLAITLTVLALAALLWTGYFKSSREMRFSYHSIFCIGLAVWATLIGAILIGGYIGNISMINLYGVLESAPVYFAFGTFPLIFVFAVLLTVSNISLIRHEGFRFTNLLGILLSVIMIAGFVALFLFNDLYTSGSAFQIDLWGSVTGLLYSVYSILECFLLGSIVCGTRAAKHQPAYDKDYIVILGCMIRDDGTLYPLIKGRADRALRFYREQLEATGKKAVFIPSGGKGDDEPISEGEAVGKYLMEQGIPSEQIIPETRSANTRENMLFSKEITGGKGKAIFSTTNYHVFRSGIVSREAGFDADGMGCPTKWYFWPNAYVREVIGMLSCEWNTLVIILIPIAAFLTVIRFTF